VIGVPDRDPLTGVPPSRHPFQFWALTACFLSGVASAIGPGKPGTMQELLPDYMVDLWGWTMMVGGLLGLIAGFWKDRITGLLMERLALLTIGGVTLVYGVVVLAVGGLGATTAGTFCLSMSVASFWRVVHVNRELRTLSRWIEQNELY
jgi:hypothetical protein